MKLKNGAKIVFAGDSITDCGRNYPYGEGLGDSLGTGYVRTFDVILAVDYPEKLIRNVNMGISGNTSDDLLARWDKDILSQNPDVVVLLIGVNDVWRQFDCPAIPDWSVDPEKFRANLNAMADKTKCEQVWMTPYYLEPNREDAMRKRMDEYGAIVKEEAAKRGIPCIDLQALFDEYLKKRYPAYITWDRVHPNRVGGLIIARALLKHFGC